MSEAPSSQNPASDSVTRWIAFGVIALSALGIWGRLSLASTKPSGANKGLGSALVSVEKRLTSLRREASLSRLKRDCAEPTCDCALAGIRAAFDLQASSDGAALIEVAAKKCSEAALTGARSELLTRQGQRAEARALAERALTRDDKDAFALYSLAMEEQRKGSHQQALAFAVRSAEAGRGLAAINLEGFVAYTQNQLPYAKAAFQRALALEPNDTDALYNLALVAQRLDQYRDARESYLKVTRLDPSHQNARYNLAVLTQSVGARAEAEHHLARFAELAPNDARVGALRALIEQTPSNASSPLGSVPAPNPSVR